MRNVAILALVMSIAMLGWTPVRANTEQEDSFDAVVHAVEEADAATDPVRKVRALEFAEFKIRQMRSIAERLASSDEGAQYRRLLERLRLEGLDADVLTLSIVAERVRLLPVEAAGRADAWLLGEQTLRQVAEKLDRLTYLAAAYFLIGRALADDGQQENAGWYVDKLLTMAEAQAVGNERAAIAGMAASLAARCRGALSVDVLRGLALLSGIRERSTTLRQLMRQELDGEVGHDLSEAELTARANQALRDYKLPIAAMNAVALPVTNSDRPTILRQVIAAALAVDDLATARTAMFGISDKAQYREVLRQVTESLEKRGQLADAISTFDLLLSGEARIEGFRALGLKLAKLGYVSVAEDVLEKAMEAARAAGSRQVAKVARDMANAGLVDTARDAALTLPEGKDRSFAIAAVVKRLSDRKRVAEAEDLLKNLVSDRDLEYALSGLGRAKAATGDLVRAEQILTQLTEADHRDRVLEALADRLARDGAFDQALARANAISDTEQRIESLLDIVKEANGDDAQTVTRAALGRAVEALQQVDVDERDRFLWKVVETQAVVGDIDAAGAIAESITDEAMKRKARSLIARAILRSKRTQAPTLPPLPVERATQEAGAAPIEEEAVVPAVVADELRVGLTHDRELLPEALRSVVLVNDPPWRRRVLRDAAETMSRQLDILGLIGGKRQVRPAQSGEGLSVAQRLTQEEGAHVNVARLSGEPDRFKRLRLPELTITAESVKAQVPAATGGSAALALMGNEAYFAKFYDDLPGGEFTVNAAARGQATSQPRYLLIESGVVWLKSLAERFGPEVVSVQDGIVTLQVPALVAPGATLVLTGLEAAQYRLRADRGVFLVNAGTLYVVGTELVGWDVARGGPRIHLSKADSSDFRPFLVNWSGSHTYIADSHLVSLGYHAPKAFGLAFSAGPSSVTRQGGAVNPTGTVVDSTIENFEYGFYSYEADHVLVIGNEFRDNVIYGVDPHDRSKELVFAYNTAYGTKAKHGIIQSREVDESYIIGNIAFDNAGSGYMLDRDSVGNIIYANYAFGNKQDGISIYESSCNLLLSNLLEKNKRAGIKLRNSWDLAVYYNTIVQNRRSAIEGYILNLQKSAGSKGRDFVLDPYEPITTFAAAWNTIEKNGSGIHLNGVTGTSLLANKFRYVNRRMFAGDAKAAGFYVLSEQDGMALTSQCRPRPLTFTCPLRDRGVLGDELFESFFDPDGPQGGCVNVPGSVQSAAYNAAK